MSAASEVNIPQFSFKHEAWALLDVAWPMIIAQGGLVFMGIIDTWMIGRISAQYMAAVALGNSIMLAVMVLGVGIGMGLEPLVSQAFGAGELDAADSWVWQGVWTALLMSVPIALLALIITWSLGSFGVKEALLAPAATYVYSRLPGLVFNLTASAFRSYLTSIARPRVVLVSVVVAAVANILLDPLFIFVFDMGVAGVGIATSICWLIMLLIQSLTAYYGHEGEPTPPAGPDFKKIRKLVGLGLPIGFQMSAEVTMFSMVTLMIGRLGAIPLAAHQIVQNLSGFTFMAATGISISAAARVGRLIGAGDRPRARRVGLVGIAMGTTIMATGAIIYWIFRTEIISSFVPNDPEVVPLGISLLLVAALGSVADGTQAVSTGALRGLGDTRVPFMRAVFGYWVVGFPLGFVLANVVGLGVIGYWIGITLGLATVAVLLFRRFWTQSQLEIARV